MATHLTTDLTADQLGWIINDAFDDVNDIGGMNEACWAIVAKKVAEALKLKLSAEEGE
jgi:hypothetical protein